MNLNIEKGSIPGKGNSLLGKLTGWLSIKSHLRPDIDMGNKQDDLIESIREAKVEWLSATANFEQAVDESMVDYYTYQIKACEVRYQYLLKEAKEKGLKV